MRPTRLSGCLAAVLISFTGLALSQATTALPDASTTAAPVAHVYVSDGTHVSAFSAAPNGKLTKVPGSPFSFSLTDMSANGHYLFGFEPSSVILDSFKMAAN